MRASFAALLLGAACAWTVPAIADQPTEDEAGEDEDEGEAPAPPARPEDVTIVVPSGAQTTIVTTGGAAPAPSSQAAPPREYEDRIPEKDEDEARFRGGVSGLIGLFVPGPVLQLGAVGRLGVQINDLFAIYGDFGAHAGLGFGVGDTASGAEASVSLGAAVFVSLMGELTIEDVFFVGVGPTILYGSFVTFESTVSQSAVGSSVDAFVGPLPGIKLRTGFGFGKDRPSRRKQFTIALEGNVLFGQRYAVVDDGTTATVDDSSSTGAPVGFLGMLALGYDAK